MMKGKTMLERILNACLLSLLAGLCTGIGALIVLSLKRLDRALLGATMGFASGVMLVVAFLSLTQTSIGIGGYGVATIGFLGGALFILLVDMLLPHIFPFGEKGVPIPRFYKTGILMAVGVAIHNIPEGLVVSAGYMHLPALGIFVAITIAFHNIPEGIAIGGPLYAAKMGRGKAFVISCLSGLVEPLGALVGVLLLATFPDLIAWAMAFAGGVMVFLTADELIPTSHHCGHEHAIAFGLVLGLAFAMLLSAVLEF